ncbi:MAG TPA: hypothetical protein VHZ55_32315 [Bryobacteraceae bacterium]|nr:hypothetical protein [Bryobacteraceae bacterium]
MRFRSGLLATFVAGAIQMLASSGSGVVHEWGTFTSVAGQDGAAISWETLSGGSDLPCFVHFLDQRNLKAAAYGLVRMETPVLYFYPLKPMSVSVHIDFPNGRVTEWYPQASREQPSSSQNGWIEWNNVQLGGGSESLPNAGGASHYYTARATNAWPLESAGEREKLLFYRGIGDFGIDLKALVNEDEVSVRNDGAEPIPAAILFENHAGQLRYQIIRGLRDAVEFDLSALGGTMETLRSEFEDELTEMGLYRDEAHAMVETWRNSWFEEGLRIFYILPRSAVDALLPISILPAPEQLTRVFVGRVELLSPAMKEEIGAALTSGDVAVLRKYGRFLNAFLREMSVGSSEPPMSEQSRQFLQNAYSQTAAESWKRSCVK